MSVVIASSLGLPMREQETLIVSISTKARIPILFLRISSSALAVSKRSGGLGVTRSEVTFVPHAPQVHEMPHPFKMRPKDNLLPLFALCGNRTRNAIQPLRRCRTGPHERAVALAGRPPG